MQQLVSQRKISRPSRRRDDEKNARAEADARRHAGRPRGMHNTRAFRRGQWMGERCAH